MKNITQVRLDKRGGPVDTASGHHWRWVLSCTPDVQKSSGLKFLGENGNLLGGLQGEPDIMR